VERLPSIRRSGAAGFRPPGLQEVEDVIRQRPHAPGAGKINCSVPGRAQRPGEHVSEIAELGSRLQCPKYNLLEDIVGRVNVASDTGRKRRYPQPFAEENLYDRIRLESHERVSLPPHVHNIPTLTRAEHISFIFSKFEFLTAGSVLK
jgi:hypothetical protein